MARSRAAAARALEQSGQWRPAAQAYAVLLDEARRRATVEVRPLSDPERDLARAEARCHGRLGDPGAAAGAWARGGFEGQAAAAYQEAGDLPAAASARVREGDLAAAAALLELSGQAAVAAELRAIHQIEAGDERAAAALLEEADDPVGAARLWAQAGEHRRAGRLLEAQGDPEAAAEALAREGDGELGGVPGDASERDLNAGRRALAAGDLEGAQAALRRVREESPGYRAACRLLGDVYQRQGRSAAAAVKYGRAVEGRRPREETAETFYRAGVAWLEAGEPTEALALLTTLWEFDPSWRDVDRQRERARLRLAERAVRGSQASVRYERGEALGRGGMGVVYRAVDLVLDREVALKLLDPASDVLRGQRRRFLREARSAAALNHPNIVGIHDFGELDGDLYIAMELVEGTTLREMQATAGVLDVETLESLLAQAAGALAYAHGHGVVHCDLKPANLMWTPDGRLKIADFGLARFLHRGRGEQDVPHDRAGAGTAAGQRSASSEDYGSQQLGTPRYMSPEQLRAGHVDARTDQYSLGVTLYEMATGDAPFTGADLLRATAEARPPRPAREDLPAELEAVILRCLARDPEDRFPSAEALAAAGARR